VGAQASPDNPPAAAVESSANCTRGFGFFVKKTTQYQMHRKFFLKVRNYPTIILGAGKTPHQ
jgi:hypothetical protein